MPNMRAFLLLIDAVNWGNRVIVFVIVAICMAVAWLNEVGTYLWRTLAGARMERVMAIEEPRRRAQGEASRNSKP